MKVIVLDFDGVLLPILPNDEWSQYPRPNEEAIKNLNIVVQLSGSNVVVSSAWREERTIQELADLLKGWGVRANVIDKTAEIVDSAGDSDRLAEINEWLLAHAPDVQQFVVLDDDPTDLESLSKNLVLPKPDLGLQWHDAVEALRILGS